MTTNTPTKNEAAAGPRERRLSRIITVTFTIAACLLLAAAPKIGLAQGPPAALQEIEQSLVDLIERVEPSVVAVSRAVAQDDPNQLARDLSAFDPFGTRFRGSAGAEFEASGAGVIMDTQGMVLTQYMNVRQGERHQVTLADGRQLPAEIRAADPRSGLAVLKVDASGLPALEMGDADAVRKGQFVVTVGNPKAIVDSGEASASWGIVTNLAQRAAPSMNLNNTLSAEGRDYATTLHHLGTLMQTDAKLNWAFGGGAVVDLSGKLIGITTTAGTLPGHESPAGYAIPMTSTFRRVVEELKAGREVEYGLLGLRLRNVDQFEASGASRRGALVGDVVPGSAADLAGIRSDDLLVSVDGHPIRTVGDLQLQVGSLPPAQPVKVRLVRDGQPMEVPVRLTKYYVRGKKVVTAPQRSWRGLKVDYSTAVPLLEIDMAATPTRTDPEGCVAVVEVQPNSAADEAGIKAGMFISHVGERRVTTPDEFYEAVAGVGDVVNLRFTSEGTQRVPSPAPVPDEQ